MQEIFEGLRRCEEFIDHQNNSMVSLDDKDLEYLEAAILLHSVGLVMGKKGYHKQSYHIIKVCDVYYSIFFLFLYILSDIRKLE